MEGERQKEREAGRQGGRERASEEINSVRGVRTRQPRELLRQQLPLLGREMHREPDRRAASVALASFPAQTLPLTPHRPGLAVLSCAQS